VSEVIRAMINTLVQDLTRTTAGRIARLNPRSVEEVRAGPPLAAFSDGMRAQADALKHFLLQNLYRHAQVLRMTGKARRIVRELFRAFLEDPRLLAEEYRREDDVAQARAIADYIAGMTDRYAIREHRALYVM
jgi:dGTPase